ncbi:hypothetical protein [Acinetobacter nosocomialis]|uniref:hypothetical protein n=1 Tax=Acinetobacter nosocomialis TaxID=106654 RepID=UPI0012504498|nr:hypothetical protein [Acinetobacter nosocomialis]
MSSDYPKMLYKGNKQKYEHVTAHDECHEKELRDAGHADYADLDDVKPEVEVIAQVSGSSGELEKAKNKIEELEEQLATAKGEYISKINKLKKENALLEYSAKDANELKAILDEKGIKYGSRDGKDLLVNLVLDSIFKTE